jgi:hypothetical protein
MTIACSSGRCGSHPTRRLRRGNDEAYARERRPTRKIKSMIRFSLPSTVALLCVNVWAWQNNHMDPRSWSGVIINSGCTPDEAFAESDKCLERRGPDAKLSLYDDTIRQIYELDVQNQAGQYFGESVTVDGTLQGNTIHVAGIRKLTSIGLEVGQRAPSFSARDQFGHAQNLGTLKGPKGTVLLFFRSADW